MRLIGNIRLGRDVEVRYTNSGTPVATLAGAWNYGMRDEQTGKRPTQWAYLSLWGERAEKLAEWLKRGGEFFVVAGEVHIETYQTREGGQGFKLTGKVESIDFTAGSVRDDSASQGGGQQQQRRQAAPAPAPAPAARQQSRPAPRTSTGFDDMDDDIPF